MRLFGRYIAVSGIAIKASLLAKSAAGIFATCSQPFMVLKAYIFKKNIPDVIKLRNGMRVQLSDNRNDIVTFVLVFCRKEYGAIGNHKTVIDVGANIGLFALYAASQGCEKIIAIEPNTISFNTLVKNIEVNKLQNKIEPLHIAVSNTSGEQIFIPKVSNPENISVSVVNAQQRDMYEAVDTLSLADLTTSRNLHKVDLLKMDCEGAEFQILLPMSAGDLAHLDNIVMEYHDEPQPLLDHLAGTGFRITQFKKIIDTKIKVGIIEATRMAL